MSRKHQVRVRRHDAEARIANKLADKAHLQREKAFIAIRVTPEQYAELRKPMPAKKYIQMAIEVSAKSKNREVLLAALRNVASATNNKSAQRLLAISDGDFLSVNDVLLELGFCLRFDGK
jgi:hypothetical protein